MKSLWNSISQILLCVCFPWQMTKIELARHQSTFFTIPQYTCIPPAQAHPIHSHITRANSSQHKPWLLCVSRSTAQNFLAAFQFLDVLSQFGELTPEVLACLLTFRANFLFNNDLSWERNVVMQSGRLLTFQAASNEAFLQNLVDHKNNNKYVNWAITPPHSPRSLNNVCKL